MRYSDKVKKIILILAAGIALMLPCLDALALSVTIDLDNDGTTEQVYTTYSSESFGEYTYFIKVKRGNTDIWTSPEYADVQSFYEYNGFSNLYFADLNDDGILDIFAVADVVKVVNQRVEPGGYKIIHAYVSYNDSLRWTRRWSATYNEHKAYYKYQGITAISCGDVNGDNILDIFVTSNVCHVVNDIADINDTYDVMNAYLSGNGSLSWSYAYANVFDDVDTQPSAHFVDLDGDEDDEFLFLHEISELIPNTNGLRNFYDKVYMFDNSGMKWSAKLEANDNPDPSFEARDMDGDGDDEALFNSAIMKKVYIFDVGGLRWTFVPEEEPEVDTSTNGIDLDGDGSKEQVVTSFTYDNFWMDYTYFLKVKRGDQELWSSPEYDEHKAFYEYSGFSKIYYKDLNRDNILDIIVVARVEHVINHIVEPGGYNVVHAYVSYNNGLQWRRNLEAVYDEHRAFYKYQYIQEIFFDDINNDSILDIFIVGDVCHVVNYIADIFDKYDVLAAYVSQSGRAEWQRKWESVHDDHSSTPTPYFVNLDGSGGKELLMVWNEYFEPFHPKKIAEPFEGWQDKVYCYDSNGVRWEYLLDCDSNPNPAPIFSDMDGDGDQEVIITNEVVVRIKVLDGILNQNPYVRRDVIYFFDDYGYFGSDVLPSNKTPNPTPYFKDLDGDGGLEAFVDTVEYDNPRFSPSVDMGADEMRLRNPHSRTFAYHYWGAGVGSSYRLQRWPEYLTILEGHIYDEAKNPIEGVDLLLIFEASGETWKYEDVSGPDGYYKFPYFHMLVSYYTVFSFMYALWPDSVEDFYLKEYEYPSENDKVYTAVESVRGTFAVIAKKEGCGMFKPIPIYANGSVVEPLGEPEDIDMTHEADFSTVDTYHFTPEGGGGGADVNVPVLKILHYPEMPARFEYDFEAQRLYSISGRLQYRNGALIQNEKVYVCTKEALQTGSDGRFIQNNLPDVSKSQEPDAVKQWFIAVPADYTWDPPEGEGFTWYDTPQSIPDIEGQFYILTISKTDEDIKDIVFIAENPTISGHVRDGGVDGTNLSGVRVTITSGALPGGPRTATTNAAGNYTFINLFNGTYNVQAQDFAHPSYDFGPARTIDVKKNITQNFYTYVISGRIVGEDGLGLNGIAVEIDDNARGAGVEYTATTGNGPDGRPGYYEQRVIEGSYVVKVKDGQ